MFIKFTLTMPNVGSWNGRWTGEGQEYSKVRNYTKSHHKEMIERILKNGSYFYNFGDGWSANIAVEVIDAAEKNRTRKKSLGFRGYDWMVDSIEKYGKIMVEKDQEESINELEM